MTIALKHGPLFPSRAPQHADSTSRNGGKMSPSQNSTVVAKNGLDFSQKAFGFFRKVYPVKVHENVAADIGYSASTLRKLEERGGYPSLPMFMAMADAYGCDFLHAVSGWGWLDAHVRKERIAKLKAEIAEIEAEIEL